MIDFFVSASFVIMSALYFFIANKKKQIISTETEIVGIFGMISVSCCFLFGYLGFINPFLEAIGQFPYLVLGYSGTLASLNAIREYNTREKAIIECYIYRELKKTYIVSTIIYIICEYTILLIAVIFQSNMILMISNIVTPVYLMFLVIANFVLLHEKGINIIGNKSKITIFRSYIVIAVTISLYEYIDLFIFIMDIDKYAEWGIIYQNPTKIFDITWILINIVCFLFLPRILLLLKRGKK